MEVDTFPNSTCNSWSKQQKQEAIACKFCKMRIAEVKTVREQFDQYERDVREEHKAMLRELKACKAILGPRGLDHLVRAHLQKEYPDIYGEPPKKVLPDHSAIEVHMEE